MEKTVVELFAGVGGFRCGLNHVTFVNDKVIEPGSWHFVWANQWEPATVSQDAFLCYTRHFGEKHASNIDIHQVPSSQIPNHTLLVGGFPCQDYSVAKTLSQGKGIEGKKGVLWWDIHRILKDKRPPFVLLENVDRLLLSPAKQRGRDFGIMLRCFSQNGYAVEWRVINAADYGFPQKRRRIFIFAYHKSTKHYQEMCHFPLKSLVFKRGIFVQPFPIQKNIIKEEICDVSRKCFKTLLDVSNQFQSEFYQAGAMRKGKIYSAKVEPIIASPFPLKQILEKEPVDAIFFLDEQKLKQFEYLKGPKKIPRVKPNGENYLYSEGGMPFPDNLEAPARTMLTSEGTVNRSTHVVEDFCTKKIRLITPVEAEKINGFPQNWTSGMPIKKRYFMMGNALVVGVIEKIGMELEKIVEAE